MISCYSKFVANLKLISWIGMYLMSNTTVWWNRYVLFIMWT